MELSAKDVSKALRQYVAPLLRGNGFDDSTARKFWRHRDGKTDHIEIESTSAYYAKLDGCTTASFTVRMGISLPQYGFHLDPYQRDYITNGPKGPRPRESQMPIRGVLCPTGSPSLKKVHWGWECQTSWEIDSMEDAEASAIDLRHQLETIGLDWLSRDWDLDHLARLLKKQEARPFLITADNGSHLRLDAELPGSPIRQVHIDMVEKALRTGIS